MDKPRLLHCIISILDDLHASALSAAQQSHDTATHEENVAENKYDTLGLEAAYLAHGQSQRVAECASDLALFREFKLQSLSNNGCIEVGSLVTVTDEEDLQLKLFLGPGGGGVKVPIDEFEILIVTTASPLGQALLGKSLDDEFELKIGDRVKEYSIDSIE